MSFGGGSGFSFGSSSNKPTFSFGTQSMYDGSELTRPDQSQGSAPAATHTTPAPGAAFGGTSTTESKPPAFSFGGSTTPAAQPPANLFGSKPAATGSSGLFGQGNPGSQGATTTPTQAPATGGLFGAAKPAAATGFSFGKPAENAEAPKTGGFSFGKPAEAPKPSGFSFGKPAESTEAPKSGGFSFGKPAESQKLPRRVAFRLASLQRRPRKHPSQAASLLASPLKKRMSPLQRQNLLKREICSASRRHLPREHRQIPSLLMSLCLHRPCCVVRAWRTL